MRVVLRLSAVFLVVWAAWSIIEILVSVPINFAQPHIVGGVVPARVYGFQILRAVVPALVGLLLWLLTPWLTRRAFGD